MTLIEVGARALCNAKGLDPDELIQGQLPRWRHFVDRVEPVLLALRDNPPTLVLNAGLDAIKKLKFRQPASLERRDAGAVLVAMINAGLEYAEQQPAPPPKPQTADTSTLLAAISG